MSYLSIENLYRPEGQAVLAFPMVYALEKVHGSSAHVSWKDGSIHFFSGGAKHSDFLALFDPLRLHQAFREHFGDDVQATVYGEVYGGKLQGMRETYGDRMRFVVFDVRVGEMNSDHRVGWLNVPEAEAVAGYLGLEFVHYAMVPGTVEALNTERDRPSTQAVRNGIAEPRIAEGVVIRPLRECYDHRGRRVIAKHKRAEFSETRTPREVDPEKRAILTAAETVADEHVTEMRLQHVLDKLGNPTEMSATGKVIRAMVEDVCREAAGEFVETKEVRKAIGAAAARLFRRRVMVVQATGKDLA